MQILSRNRRKINKMGRRIGKICRGIIAGSSETPMLDPAQAKWMNVTPQKIKKLQLIKFVSNYQIISYLQDIKNIDTTSSEVFEYWQSNTTRWSELTQAALLTLCIPCTNVEAKRSFSAYSRIVTPQRYVLR